ncbi:hypothetical protein ACQI4L_17065 [Mycolicibacterium litorale]|uniref:hypothetical protein n=1 Tax=Mycolicibacterium litorale TaxID=758802 RepID=UPI003CEE2623
MSETPSSPDPQTEPVYTPPPQPAYVETREDRRRPNRATTIAAWVGIVAGVVFIVAVVFFSGYVLGKNSAGGGGHHRDGGPGHGMMFHRDGPPAGMFPMGPRGQFERPGMPFGPGQPGMQPAEPAQPGSPTTTAPARP